MRKTYRALCGLLFALGPFGAVAGAAGVVTVGQVVAGESCQQAEEDDPNDVDCGEFDDRCEGQ